MHPKPGCAVLAVCGLCSLLVACSSGPPKCGQAGQACCDGDACANGLTCANGSCLTAGSTGGTGSGSASGGTGATNAGATNGGSCLLDCNTECTNLLLPAKDTYCGQSTCDAWECAQCCTAADTISGNNQWCCNDGIVTYDPSGHNPNSLYASCAAEPGEEGQIGTCGGGGTPCTQYGGPSEPLCGTQVSTSECGGGPGPALYCCVGICGSPDPTWFSRYDCCVTSCGNGAGAPKPQTGTLCNGVCTDLPNDPKNCNACGNVCPGAALGPLCRDGVCSTFCPSGDFLCDGGCVAPDMYNCQGCGQACPFGMDCQSNTCVCSSGTTLCGSTCQDVQNDPKHCGTCTTVCPPEQAPAACFDGGCVVTPGVAARDQPYAFDFYAESAGNVAWVTEGTVNPSRPDSGGTLMLAGIVIPGQNNPRDVAGQAAFFRWINTGVGAQSDEILRIPTSGGNYTRVPTGGYSSCCMVADDNFAYWADEWSPSGNGTLVGRIARAPADGGAVQTFESGTGPTALDATNVYYFSGSTDGGSIVGASVSSGQVNVLVPGVASPGSLVVDGTSIYWFDETTLSLWKAPLSGGGPAVVLVDAGVISGFGGNFRYLATDGVNVYFPSNNWIVRVPVGGGPVRQIVASPQPRDLRIDGTDLFWISGKEIQFMITF